jgi:DNA-binding GntR family transcriptional regulator
MKITPDIDLLQAIPSPHTMVGRTVQERVLVSLRGAIVSGTLPAGYRLRQTDIAVAMGVSVTPVREALRDLAAEGLVRLDAHRGGVVMDIDLADFTEVRALLDTLWPVLARSAAERITEPQIAALWALQHRIEADPASYPVLNLELHAMIVDAARSPRTRAMLATLQVAAERVVARALGETAPHRLEEGIREHRTILAALEAHDPQAAVEAVLAHQRPTWDAVETALRAEGDVVP